jgi:AmpD protein
MIIGADGWVGGLRRLPSPHFDRRPDGVPVELLIVHNISVPPGRFGGGLIERLFLGQPLESDHPFIEQVRGLRASAHFVIDRSGQITQFVSCDERAWHAGVSVFEGRAGCNDFSIGVELEGSDFTTFEAGQYAALARLTQCLRAALPLRAVRGHSHVAVGRKTDPGPLFDWHRYARQAGLPGHWLP